MCLLKVYIDDPDLGRKLIARNVAFVLKENGFIKIMDLESREKIIADVEIMSIDALNSILILKKSN